MNRRPRKSRARSRIPAAQRDNQPSGASSEGEGVEGLRRESRRRFEGASRPHASGSNDCATANDGARLVLVDRAPDRRQPAAEMACGMKTCSILLVDDFEDALEIYEQYLTYRGFQVVAARSGQEAIAQARAHRPDLILLDVRMPGMTGTEVMQILRADSAFVNTLIIALTAHALDEERLDALRAGFDAVIAKPCLPDALVAAVESILAERSSRSVNERGRLDSGARTHSLPSPGPRTEFV